MKRIEKEKLAEYEEYLREEEKSKNTIAKYMRDLKAFEKWQGEEALSKSRVLEYKDYLVASGYAPRSVNSVLSSLNSFFEFCGYYDVKVKMLKIQQQIFISEKTSLSKSEYLRLLSAANRQGREQLYLLMQTICATGIRISELPYITVESLKNRKAIINLKGKMRVVIIPDNLCKVLLRHTVGRGIHKGSVFVTKNGKSINRTQIWRMLRSLCDDAGVPKEKVFPHNFRHLFARTYYSSQKDIVRLADILGHSSVNTTRIYTMETGEVHRQQLQKLGLLRLGKE